jgi:hypothetical protein
VPGADNQQERSFIEAVPASLGSFLSGFALGEGSFMLVCRKRDDYARRFKISAAFNVSQRDRVPLDLFREVAGCGTLRKAGNGGWYWEVNSLPELVGRILPFFDRFPIVGQKAPGLPVVERGCSASRRWASRRPRVRACSCSPRTDEPRRKETLSDGRNPQRLYAEPVG